MNKSCAIGLALVVCSACQSDDPAADKHPQRIPKVDDFMNGTIRTDWAPLAPDELYEGRTLEQWGVEYMRWAYAQDTCEAPMFDQDGSQCRLYQDPESPVFFLDTSPVDKVRTKCRIPAGKGIVVPMAAFSNDNAGVDEPLTEEQLIGSAKEVLASMRDLKLLVDDKKIGDVADRAFGPTKFEYTLPPAPNWYSCNGTPGVEDITVSPSYVAGYIAVFPPPDPGTHELQYAGSLTFDGDEYATNTRTRFVVEDADE